MPSPPSLPVAALGGAATLPPRPVPAEARAAGVAFEAMMIERLLSQARAASPAPATLSSGGGEWRQMADRRLAETLAVSSPLGLADAIARAAAAPAESPE